MKHITRDTYTGVRIIRYLLTKETIVLKEPEKMLFIIEIYKMRIKPVNIIEKQYNVHVHVLKCQS